MNFLLLAYTTLKQGTKNRELSDVHIHNLRNRAPFIVIENLMMHIKVGYVCSYIHNIINITISWGWFKMM